MTTRSIVVAAFLMFWPAAGAQSVDVSGDWAVTITTSGGKMAGTASLEQADGRVSGQIGPNGDATIPIEGVIDGTKVTLKTNPQPGRTAAFERCDLTVRDRKMVGTIRGGDAVKGTIEFVRAKR